MITSLLYFLRTLINQSTVVPENLEGDVIWHVLAIANVTVHFAGITGKVAVLHPTLIAIFHCARYFNVFLIVALRKVLSCN